MSPGSVVLAILLVPLIFMGARIMDILSDIRDGIRRDS